MKRLALVVALMALTALLATPIASSHTGTATITCEEVTFTFEQFKDPTTLIRETVLVGPAGNRETIASFNFTLVGPSGSNTIAINLPPGTHEVIARAEWSDSEGDSFFRVRRIVTCDGQEPPGDGCTLTKGFYRNHAAETASIIAGMGGTLQVGNKMLTASQVQAILKARPGKPGNVTFTSNLLLNLVQQLIAAELNIGSDADAPASVEDAIDDANAEINVTTNGTIALSTTLSHNERSALVEALSSFNEGKTGAPHCD